MSPRGVLTLCRCGAHCTATGARTCDCDFAREDRDPARDLETLDAQRELGGGRGPLRWLSCGHERHTHRTRRCAIGAGTSPAR